MVASSPGGRVGLAHSGEKTAVTPKDGFARGMGVYPGPCIVPPEL